VSTWLIWWFVVAIVSTAAVAAVAIALVRHVMVLGRVARRAREELNPVVREISGDAARAGAHAAGLSVPRSGRRQS
jgi:hypothetical protein